MITVIDSEQEVEDYTQRWRTQPWLLSKDIAESELHIWLLQIEMTCKKKHTELEIQYAKLNLRLVLFVIGAQTCYMALIMQAPKLVQKQQWGLYGQIDELTL